MAPSTALKFVCPNCSAEFSSGDSVVQHLSTQCPCGLLDGWRQSYPDRDDNTANFTQDGGLRFLHSMEFHSMEPKSMICMTLISHKMVSY